MKVIRAKVLGFCMGVRRAVEMSASEIKSSCGTRVYTLGPLIHNKRVLADLKNMGVETLENSEADLKGCSVIIRAHGISSVKENNLRKNGARIIDATCPKVRKNQLKTEELSRAGFFLFLAGEANHAEIEGILGYAECASFCTVAGNVYEAEIKAAKLYKTNNNAKTALLGQTTISEKEYLAIAETIKKYFPDLEIIHTICAASIDRQQALRDLLEYVDAAIIAGCRESANTRCLLAIAEESGKPCVLAEDSAEIPMSFKQYDTIGLTAGASTPDSLIDEIENYLVNSFS